MDNGIKRLKACQGKTNQARLDNFFKAGGIKTSDSAKNTKSKSVIKAGGARKSGKAKLID